MRLVLSGAAGAAHQYRIAARLNGCLICARLQHDADGFTKQAEEFLQQAREARRHAAELNQQLNNARKARFCPTACRLFARRAGSMPRAYLSATGIWQALLCKQCADQQHDLREKCIWHEEILNNQQSCGFAALQATGSEGGSRETWLKLKPYEFR